MENKIKYGIIHIHSENSLKDSALNIDDLVNRAGELGAPAIVLTDHGTLTGTEDFKKAVAKYNKENKTTIKAIPGVEAYFEEDDDLIHRCHLILIPKDKIGFRAIAKAVTASNHRQDSLNIPRMNMEILKEFFGKDSNGHGHVIATSACMQGVIASILNQNSFINKDIAKLESKREDLCSPLDPDYRSARQECEAIEDEIAKISELIKELQKIAKKPYTKKEKALNAFLGTPEYEEHKKALDAEKAESAAAQAESEHLKEIRDDKKNSLKLLKTRRKEYETSVEKWTAITQEIDSLKESVASSEGLYQKAKEQARKYVEIFGEGNFYAELQYHRIPEEAELMPLVAEIAGELHLPVVAANDAHMATNTEDELRARQLMRSLRFNKWDTMNESDKELYIKTDEELSSILCEILTPEVVERAIRGIGDIINACDDDFSENESHYPVFSKTEPASKRLRQLCEDGIEWRYPQKNGWTEEHQRRMEYELDIIEKLGYCDYLCIVEDFLRYGRLLGKMDIIHPDPRYLEDPFNMDLLEEITKDMVGQGVGPGRGSGVGSLVCYLVGITGVDPMLHGLYFERFLNVERVSPPDIDSDIASSIRDKVIEYVKHKYGENAVCCIMTRQTQQAKAAIRNCARLLGLERFNEKTYYLDLGDDICKALPQELNIKLDACVDDLNEQFKDDEAALKIISNALLIENTFTNIGMHAAGVIIADNGDVREYVPLCYISGTNQFATQYDKVQVEKIGLLKMDFLGLINLDIITHALRLVQKKYGVIIDIEQVPFEKEVFENIFATGNTNAVFQFESAGMKNLLRRFKPDSIQHITLLNAMYRPGPIQFLEAVIDVKNGVKTPDYVIPEMESILGETYGYPIFQEQLMSIFNKFAGFTLGEADIIRRAMAKKKISEFMSYKDKFVRGMMERGGKKEKVEEFWEQLLKFAEYAFNKSHSCAYAHVAYYTAYLKHHYPQEYFCAVLNHTKSDKLCQMIKNCKTSGIKLLPPDINYSENEFTSGEGGILYGLGSIKNIGTRAETYIFERNDKGKYLSFAEFLLRTRAEKDAVESFIQAGAFDNFCANREALLQALPRYSDCLKKIKDKEKALLEKADTREKEEKYKAQLGALLDKFNTIEIDDAISENLSQKLIREKDMLGTYISSHPLDSYEIPDNDEIANIDTLAEKGFVSVCGVISELKIKKRKNDGSNMAFFTLEDKTGLVEVCCFASQFKRYGSLLEEDVAVKVRGTCQIENNNEEDPEDITCKIIADSIIVLKERKNAVVLYINSVMEWADCIRPQLNQYIDKDGCPLIIYDKMMGIYRKTKLFVNKNILENQNNWETAIM